MTLETDMSALANMDHSEQSLLDFPEPRSSRAWSRQAIGDPALSADAGSDFIRARMPTPQAPPAGERHIVDLPPLHDNDRSGTGQRRRKSPSRLLSRRTLALALAAPLFAAATAGGYLYWNYSRHFQSTDDAFIAARSSSIAPKVSGYITAVPVTDNQHACRRRRYRAHRRSRLPRCARSGQGPIGA